MSNINDKITDVDAKLLQLQQKIKELDAEKAKLVTEKSLAKNKNRPKEYKELVDIRESVKNLIDKYNELSGALKVKTNIGLLTNGGHLIYDVNEDGETNDGEYFSDNEYDVLNKYPSYAGWYPSSMSC